MIDILMRWQYILQPVVRNFDTPDVQRETRMVDSSLKAYLSTQEVSELLSINEKLVYSLISEKGLPATKITGKWLFPRHFLDKWFNSQIPRNQNAGIEQYTDRGIIIMSGSDDPLLQMTLSLFHQQQQGTIFLANQGSIGGLASLKRGLCHVASCHLLRQDDRGYDDACVGDDMHESPPVVVNFCQREQGIVTQKGNPKNIRSITDLAGPGVRIVNRPLGSGTRLVFDYEIARSEISIHAIRGYRQEASGCLDAGIEVLSGRADAAPAVRAVADQLDLHFLPLRWERFDLLISREQFFEQPIKSLINILHGQAFRNLASMFSGYNLSLSGKLFPYGRQSGQ